MTSQNQKTSKTKTTNTNILNPLPSYRDSRWLITGGTSGLGLALTELLVASGARVAIVARGGERLHAVAERTGAIPIEADISDKQAIHRISAQAIAQLGGLDGLINNASALGPTPLRLLLDTECEDLESVLQTNVLGPFRLTKAILPTLILQGRGWVIDISSDAGVNGYPTWGAYGVSKAALDQLTRVWGAEIEGSGVRFISVDPGDMDTPMHAAAIPDADPSSLKRPMTSATQLLTILRARDFKNGERISL